MFWKPTTITRHDDHFLDIVGMVTFALMHRLGIRQAFTNDKHFAAAGFETLF